MSFPRGAELTVVEDDDGLDDGLDELQQTAADDAERMVAGESSDERVFTLVSP